MILLIGMAVGVDYALFYLRREREERDAGRSPLEAIDIAAATSGRAVLVSGLTVLVAMAGMFFTGHATFMSFAVGTMLVVAVAMIGSLTVLPAMLSWLGPQGRQGPDPVPRAASAAPTASRASGTRSSTASSGTRRSRPSPPPRSCSPSPSRRSG